MTDARIRCRERLDELPDDLLDEAEEGLRGIGDHHRAVLEAKASWPRSPGRSGFEQGQELPVKTVAARGTGDSLAARIKSAASAWQWRLAKKGEKYA